MDTITYQIARGVYINLTNKCSNDCTFCERNRISGVEGYFLWLQNEPTASEIIDSLTGYDTSVFDEVIFCGFGEPTYKWEVIKEVANFAHKIGKSTRLNTNGQGNLINGYDITEQIAKYIDKVNVSLNNGNAKRYDEVSRSMYGEAAFEELQNFGAKCLAAGVETTFSVVDCIPAQEIEEARQIAQRIGAKFRVREEIK